MRLRYGWMHRCAMAHVEGRIFLMRVEFLAA